MIQTFFGSVEQEPALLEKLKTARGLPGFGPREQWVGVKTLVRGNATEVACTGAGGKKEGTRVPEQEEKRKERVYRSGRKKGRNACTGAGGKKEGTRLKSRVPKKQ
jgi:hypothetical protein